MAKRYRYTSKERDEESGLYYHGARYYIPWLCRWTAVDPMESKYAGISPYNYAFNNPIMFNDPSGADPGDEGEKFPEKPKVGEEFTSSSGKNYIYSDSGGGVWTNLLPPSHTYGSQTAVNAPAPVDGANSYYRDMAIHNIMNVSQVELNRKFKSEQELRQNIYDNQRFIGSDGNGKFYNTSRAQVKQQQFEQSQQVFDALRGGPFSSLGYHMFGERGALSFSRFDKVAMAFSGVGTAYGKIQPFTRTRERAPKMEQKYPPIKVDLMGGSILKHKGFILYDKEAVGSGIADEVSNFHKYFQTSTISEVIVENPQATFLTEIHSSLKSGAIVTIRGTMSNSYFNSIWNKKALGLEQYKIIKTSEDVPNVGYKQTTGKPIRGKINEIKLKKK